MNRLFRFGLVGACGFVADAGVLALLVHLLDVDPLVARVFSIAAALFVTWMLNRTFTFDGSDRSLAAEGLRYGGIGIGSSLANYCVYSALLLAIPDVPPLAALVAGSTAALIFSYLGYSRLVFDR